MSEGSASASAWHVGNDGLVVSLQQQAHRGRPRWWQMSADDASSTDTNKQLTDMIQYTTKQDWLREVLHSKESFHTSASQSKYGFFFIFMKTENMSPVGLNWTLCKLKLCEKESLIISFWNQYTARNGGFWFYNPLSLTVHADGHLHARILCFFFFFFSLRSSGRASNLTKSPLRVDRFSDPWPWNLLTSHYPFITKTKQPRLNKMHRRSSRGYLCVSDTEDDLTPAECKRGGTLHMMDSSAGTVTVMEEEISRGGWPLMYTELFILRLLFTDASHDTSQLRGFASVALTSNAQLTIKGIPRNGRKLIN